MGVKIALTGSHGTGKTTVTGKVAEHFTKQGWNVVMIESPTRFVKSLGFQNNHQDDWRLSLLSGTKRVEKQRVALQKDPDLVLADRCLGDELSYLQELMDRSDSFRVEREAVRTVLTEFFYEDLSEYWNGVFLLPPHPDYPPEGDGDRLDCIEYQERIHNQVVKMYAEKFQYPVETLSTDHPVAVEQLISAVEKLRTE